MLTDQRSGEFLLDRKLASDIYLHSIQHRGGTFDETGKPVKSGVVVSIKTLLLATVFTRRTIERAVAVAGPDTYLGTWFDSDNQRWEVIEAVVFTRLHDALRVAVLINERYVFDLDNNLSVPVR